MHDLSRRTIRLTRAFFQEQWTPQQFLAFLKNHVLGEPLPTPRQVEVLWLIEKARTPDKLVVRDSEGRPMHHRNHLRQLSIGFFFANLLRAEREHILFADECAIELATEPPTFLVTWVGMSIRGFVEPYFFIKSVRKLSSEDYDHILQGLRDSCALGGLEAFFLVVEDGSVLGTHKATAALQKLFPGGLISKHCGDVAWPAGKSLNALDVEFFMAVIESLPVTPTAEEVIKAFRAQILLSTRDIRQMHVNHIFDVITSL